jgi:hypothetical protein
MAAAQRVRIMAAHRSRRLHGRIEQFSRDKPFAHARTNTFPLK